MTHPNIELMRRYSATLTAGPGRRGPAVLHRGPASCTSRAAARTPATYRGQDAVLAYYTRIFQDTDGPVREPRRRRHPGQRHARGQPRPLAGHARRPHDRHRPGRRLPHRRRAGSPRSGCATGTSTPTTSCSRTRTPTRRPDEAGVAATLRVALHQLGHRGPGRLPLGLVAEDLAVRAPAAELGHRGDDQVVGELPIAPGVDLAGDEVAADRVVRGASSGPSGAGRPRAGSRATRRRRRGGGRARPCGDAGRRAGPGRSRLSVRPSSSTVR